MSKILNIRKALLASVSLLTMLPMLVAMLVSVALFHLETSASIKRENLRVAQTVSTAVELFISRPEVMLKHIRDVVNGVDRSEMKRLHDLVGRVMDDDPLFETVALMDAKGSLLSVVGADGESVPEKAPKQDFPTMEIFKRVKSSGQIVWSEPFVSLRSGESVMSVAIPWKDGVISGNMNLSYLCKLVEPTRTLFDDYAFIISPAGRLIAHPDRSLVGEKEAFISLPQITAGLQGTSGTYLFKIGSRKVVGSVLPFEKNGWVIVSVHDKQLAYAPLYELEKLLAVLALAVLALALTLAYRKIGKISAPLIALTESSRQLAKGEEVTERLEFSAYTEIHDLYDNFQSMSAAVRTREMDLQERNEELAVTEEELRHQVDEYLRIHDELFTEKKKLESILASMGEGLSILSRGLKVVLQNNAHREMVGDFIGRFCYEMFDHNNRPCDNCPVQAAFADGNSHVILRKLKRNNILHYFEVTASPLKDASGEIVGGIEIIRDVTDRINSENEIRRLNQELESRVEQRTSELEVANKELESFSYSVSHDLRAPLRHINSFSSILLTDHVHQLDTEGQHLLSRIIAGCEKMGLLIDALLELSYVSRQELTGANINLTQLAGRIVAGLKERDPFRNVRVEIADGLEAYGDERLLAIVLTNLIENSWKYTSLREDSLIEFGCQKSSGRPVFFVRDNGAGFDKIYAEKLFVPFSRLHGAEFEGTGIGLTIVQRVIYRHGGKIWADSAPDEGATFYFTLGESHEPCQINTTDNEG